MEKFREVEARRRAEDEERAREKEITEQEARQEIEMRKGKSMREEPGLDRGSMKCVQVSYCNIELYVYQ